MKTYLTAILLILPVAILAELPESSISVVKKLNEWELERQAELQAEIKAKRTEVVEFLRKQLESTTKAGDLDGALAIKQEIERLESSLAVKSDETKTPVGPSPKTDQPVSDLFVGKTWEAPGQTLFEFKPEGVCIKTYKGTPHAIKWEFLDSGIVKAFGNGDPEFFKFKSSRSGEISKQETLEGSLEIRSKR